MSPSLLDSSVDLARDGDRAAFNRLVEAHQGLCYHVALGRLGDPDAAKDACQEAFLRAWRAIDRFQGGADPFRRWLLRILCNLCLDQLRAQGRRGPTVSVHARAGEAAAAPPLPSPDEGPEAYVLRADLAALLQRCLARLSDDHRAVVLLDQAGFGYQEMAEILEIELGTVKSRLSRARQRARDLLLGEPGAGPGRWSEQRGSLAATEDGDDGAWP